MKHTDIVIDEMYESDALVPAGDSQAYAAFCNEDNCSWRGDWHHADLAGESMEARMYADEDRLQHEADTDEMPHPDDMDGDDLSVAMAQPNGR